MEISRAGAVWAGCLAIILVVGLGWFVHHWSASTEPLAQPGSSELVAAPGPGEVLRGQALEVDRPGRRPVARLGSDPAVPVPPAAAQRLQLVDGDRRPIPFARVSLAWESLSDADLLRLADAWFDPASISSRGVSVGRTDVDGFVTLGGIEAGPVTARLHHRDFALLGDPIAALQVPQDGTLVLHAERLWVTAFRLVGAPVVSESLRPIRLTAGARFGRVPEGEQLARRLRARHPEVCVHVEVAAEEQDWEAVFEVDDVTGRAHSVTASMVPPSRFLGPRVVVPEAGDPPGTGTLVAVLPPEFRGLPVEVSLRAHGPRHGRRRAVDPGVEVALRPGRYDVWVDDGGWFGEFFGEEVEVEVLEGRESIVELLAHTPCRSATIELRCPDGGTPPGAFVYVERDGQSFSAWAGPVEARFDVFLPPGRCTVRFETKHYEDASVTIDVPEDLRQPVPGARVEFRRRSR